MTCNDITSFGWCDAKLSLYDLAVNRVSIYKACGASCPELCGESFDAISAAIDLLAFQNMSLLANLGQL